MTTNDPINTIAAQHAAPRGRMASEPSVKFSLKTVGQRRQQYAATVAALTASHAAVGAAVFLLLTR